MNSPTTLSSVPPPAPAPTIRSRAQLEVLLENIAELHRERDAAWHAQEAEIVIPAPFSRPLGSRDFGTGNIYEIRTYTYAPGDIPKVLDAWSKAIEARERFSPLVTSWTSELGTLNKFTHIWVYKDLNERARVREESRKPGGQWPPQSGVRPIRQENKLVTPAAFSPVR